MRNINFNFLNYCTRYESTGSVDVDLDSHACFSDIFDGNEYQDNYYYIEIYKRNYDSEYDSDDNNCLLTPNQIKEHLNEIKHFYKNFKYELLENGCVYELKFHIKAPLIKHKVILSWIRYLYEFPFNCFLYESFKLKKVKGFKKVNSLNRFNLIGATSNIDVRGERIHGIGDVTQMKQFMNWKEFNSKLYNLHKKSPYSPLYNIFKELNLDNIKLLKKTNKTYNLTYWCNKKNFKERVDYYKTNYKLIKQHLV